MCFRADNFKLAQLMKIFFNAILSWCFYAPTRYPSNVIDFWYLPWYWESPYHRKHYSRLCTYCISRLFTWATKTLALKRLNSRTRATMTTCHRQQQMASLKRPWGPGRGRRNLVHPKVHYLWVQYYYTVAPLLRYIPHITIMLLDSIQLGIANPNEKK